MLLNNSNCFVKNRFQPPIELKGSKLEEWKREHPSYAYSERQIRVDRQRLALRMLREGNTSTSGGESGEVESRTEVNGVAWVRHDGGGGHGETKSSGAEDIVNLGVE